MTSHFGSKIGLTLSIIGLVIWFSYGKLLWDKMNSHEYDTISTQSIYNNFEQMHTLMINDFTFMPSIAVASLTSTPEFWEGMRTSGLDIFQDEIPTIVTVEPRIDFKKLNRYINFYIDIRE